MARPVPADPTLDPDDRLYAGADQPAHRGFRIAAVTVAGRSHPVAVEIRATAPHHRLLRFRARGLRPKGEVLLVPPISGTFPVLMRDVVAGLLPDFRVHVLDWTNPRHVPLAAGPFGFAGNIDAILAAEAAMPPGSAILGLCQAGVPALAAVALMAAAGRDRPPPGALVLMGAPVDPDAAPTPVAAAVRAHSPAWDRRFLIWPVHAPHAGQGRLVHPAWMQLAAIRTYLANRRNAGGEIARKLDHDDGSDPVAAPFLDLCTSVMDIDAQHFCENLDLVFRRPQLPAGRLSHHGRRVDPTAIRTTALMTVEGGADDIAAPGQTAAAHGLCPDLPDGLRARLVDPGSGHFSLFHGARWRDILRREVRDFLIRHAARRT